MTVDFRGCGEELRDKRESFEWRELRSGEEIEEEKEIGLEQERWNPTIAAIEVNYTTRMVFLER